MSPYNSKAIQIIDEVNKVVIGKRDIIEKVLTAILAKGHILLEDYPGVGKTTLALAFSKAMELEYHRLQFTPDVLPTDVVGFHLLSKDGESLQYKPGAIMCNLFLADEINRTSSKTQSALLEVMEEGKVTVDSVTREVPKPFVVMATQNPIGSIGTQMLPESQLDRFMVRLSMGYPDIRSEIGILKERQNTNPLDYVVQVVSQEEILYLQSIVESIYIHDAIYEYITYLVQQTRDNSLIELGVSPRGTLALTNMVKATAFLKGRDYVIPSDVQFVFKDVCAHRMLLKSKARINNVTVDNLLDDILRTVKPPRIITRNI
ncbi:MoxR family ATPase [Lachnospiraceae bacterium MD1]|jgi:MoxR-like ATPase|uniref:MoxR family ATPase n=1 Tax=Variimorphobacter saccharofermentans TaxID=2755051 RepID=A0A839JV22_9FIRM|nr:MoxR family ATPase [Variimorphobacter saccharofermentans]MBB2181493.1 MoxR family ATPase [Variimorphobacter saccharofermentans]